jgi:hypothetical protein
MEYDMTDPGRGDALLDATLWLLPRQPGVVDPQ